MSKTYTVPLNRLFPATNVHVPKAIIPDESDTSDDDYDSIPTPVVIPPPLPNTSSDDDSTDDSNNGANELRRSKRARRQPLWLRSQEWEK